LVLLPPFLKLALLRLRRAEVLWLMASHARELLVKRLEEGEELLREHVKKGPEGVGVLSEGFLESPDWMLRREDVMVGRKRQLRYLDKCIKKSSYSFTAN